MNDANEMTHKALNLQQKITQYIDCTFVRRST
jgi:hypothetical protein